MDIGALSTAMSQCNVQTMASMSVLKMQMTNSETMSANLTDMMDSLSIEPGKGANIEALV